MYSYWSSYPLICYHVLWLFIMPSDLILNNTLLTWWCEAGQWRESWCRRELDHYEAGLVHSPPKNTACRISPWPCPAPSPRPRFGTGCSRGDSARGSSVAPWSTCRPGSRGTVPSGPSLSRSTENKERCWNDSAGLEDNKTIKIQKGFNYFLKKCSQDIL